jgi:predicted nucleic acid-binding protein
MKRYHLDANVVLRFLRNDDPQQSPEARQLVASAKAGHVVLAISAVTVAEVFYAFRASYKLSRSDVSELLGNLLRSSVFELEHEERILDAIARVEKFNVDFGDAYLAATAVETKEAVASFDKDFKKFPDLILHALG